MAQVHRHAVQYHIRYRPNILPSWLDTLQHVKATTTHRHRRSATRYRATTIATAKPETQPLTPSPAPRHLKVHLLSIELPGVSAKSLYQTLVDHDHETNLLVQFHELAGDQGIRLYTDTSMDASIDGSLDEDLGDADISQQQETKAIKLTYHTTIPSAIPLVTQSAFNTENLTMHQLAGGEGFDVESRCDTEGVPFSDAFANYIHWAVRSSSSSGGQHLYITITAETRFHDSLKVFGPIKTRIMTESKNGMIKAYKLLETMLVSPEMMYQFTSSSDAVSQDSVLLDQIRGMDIVELKKFIAKEWPEWSRQRYWLSEVAADIEAPSAHEAALLLCVLEPISGAMKSVDRVQKYGRDPLIIGLVECLRLAPPRISSSSSSNATKAATTIDASPSTRILPNAEDLDCIRILSLYGVDRYWQDEMEVLCERIPLIPIQSSDLKQVVGMLWGLSAARHWTQHLGILEQHAVYWGERGIVGGTSKRKMQLSSCVEKIAGLGHSPKALFQVIAPHLKQGWPTRGFARIAWGIAISNELDSEVCRALLSALTNLQEEDKSAFKYGHHVMLYALFLSLKIHAPETYSQFQDSSDIARYLIEESESVWRSFVNSNLKISAVQQDVYATVQSLGYNATLETAVLGLAIDVVVETDTLKLAIEVDGPHHFSRNVCPKTGKKVGLGNVLWKRKVLQASGWTVVNVDTAVFGSIRSAVERRKYMQQEIDYAVLEGIL